MAVPGRDDLDPETRARLHWASVREPERLTPSWSDRYWSRLSRRDWGDAIGRPYERVGIGGAPGALVYAILAMFLVVVVIFLLAMTGVLG